MPRQLRDLDRRKKQPYAPRLARDSPEKPASLERQHHPVDGRRCHAKEAVHVSLRGRNAVKVVYVSMKAKY